jgi:GNAT superfamily N-acetyltransferase
MALHIIPYSAQHATDFKNLNLEWLDHYNLLESHDLMVLDDPQGTILASGGAIYLAEEDGRILGTAALMLEEYGVYELAKMTVSKDARGRGISKLLIEACLKKAHDLKAKKITLFSNHQLTTAISLYKKYGFKHVEVKDSPFLTADVKMELVL